MQLLVTRPQPGNKQTAKRLTALGHQVIACPLLAFSPTAEPLPPASDFAAIALTSANAVTALEQRKVLAPFLALPAYTVGSKTADAARQAGFKQINDADGTVGDLADLILNDKIKGAVFYPAAAHRAGELELLLERAGQSAKTVEVYEMRAAEIAQSSLPERVDGVLHYSKRTAETFIALKNKPECSFHLCLSANIATPLREAGEKNIHIAPFPDEDALLSALASLAAKHNISG